MGHALNNTLQDILCRYWRMTGGTCSGSPAPITPASRRRWWSNASSWSGRSRTAARLGREKFLERVWAWKAESGGAIVVAAQAPRRLLRLEPRALHARRRPVAGGRQGVRSALSRRARLQGQAPRQLGPEVPDRDLGPRSRAGRVPGARSSGRARTARRSTRRRSRKVLAKNPNGHLYYFDYPVVDAAARRPANA